MSFRTETGILVPAVTAEQMREVDRIAVQEFGLSILQMMENAGRILAAHTMEMLSAGGATSGSVTVLAGAGGNGGGGLCAARHLHNRGVAVRIVLDRDAAALAGAARSQMVILRAAGLVPVGPDAADALREAAVVVDALIGYGLRGAPTGRTAELIDLCNRYAVRALALDVPSGLNVTTGEAPGPVVRVARTLTLALPKIGLAGIAGDLYLADIGIPPEIYGRLSLDYTPPFGMADSARLVAD